MKVILPKKELIFLLSKLQGFLGRATLMPVLNHILINALEDNVEFLATDLEIACRTNLKTDIEKEGKTTIDGKKLYEITKEMESEKICIEKVESKVKISDGNTVFFLSSYPVEDFPLVEKRENFPITIESQKLKNMIKKTSFCISTDESRINLCGAFIEIVKNPLRLRMVATDGHRLSFYEESISEGFQIEKGVIIPRKALLELRELIKEEDVLLELDLSENQIFVKKDNFYINARLIDAEFPDYKQVIPKEIKHNVIINRENFSSVLRKIAIIARTSQKGAVFEFRDKKLISSCEDQETGIVKSEMDINYIDEPIKICLNVRYLTDVINIIDEDDVIIGINSPEQPITIKPYRKEENELHLIMPMVM